MQKNVIIGIMGKDTPGDIPKEEVVSLSKMSTK